MSIITAFRNIATKQPFFNSKDIGEGLDLFEVIFNNSKDYIALTASVWFENPLISFPTNDIWNKSPLSVKVQEMKEDCDIIETDYKIINLYSIDFFESIKLNLQKEIDKLIKSGKDVLNQNKEFIIFCSKAKEQLNDWRKSETILKQVKESLNALDEFGRKWNEGFYKYYSDNFLKECGLNHKVSKESETVLNDENLKKERMFYLPNGDEEFFENHIKLTNGIRIHFFPDNKTKKIYIGYIGEHLKLK